MTGREQRLRRKQRDAREELAFHDQVLGVQTHSRRVPVEWNMPGFTNAGCVHGVIVHMYSLLEDRREWDS